MSSVRNRILQFQTNSSTESSSSDAFLVNGSVGLFNNSYLTPTSKSNTLANTVKNGNSHTTATTVPSTNNTNSTGTMSTAINSKPVLQPKKTSMSINLSGSSESTNTSISLSGSLKPLPSPNKPVKQFGSSGTSITTGSSIPKLVHLTAQNPGFKVGNGNSGFGNIGGVMSGSRDFGRTSPGSKLYGSMDWKEKYEDAEKKRLQIVNLAQKASRDYEELRRRYQDLHSENDKIVQKYNSSTVQLDALRKASEAVYDDYYKLKKQYQVENSAKSDALGRVDEYNRENRRLKRQSAALMQHVTDSPNFDLEKLMEAEGEMDTTEHDKEIDFLRRRVQELERRVVDLESELERTKLAEFETQESVMLINDSAQSAEKENKDLKQKLKTFEREYHGLQDSIRSKTLELESVRVNEALEKEKLQIAETELRKLQTEKSILQRQSMIFMSNATLDAQVHDALEQISELQFTVEEQKLNYETRIFELQDRLNERESENETKAIETEAALRALERQVEQYQKRAEEAERKLEELPETPEVLPVACPAPPPPPPPPPCPPSLPSGLNSSIQNVTLRRNKNNSESGTGVQSNGTEKSIVTTSSPQIDDVVSQIKKGIKLRPADSRTMSRKQTDVADNPPDSTAVEEMRSILVNLKRTRRAN